MSGAVDTPARAGIAIIGGGVAGLSLALRLAPRPVVLITQGAAPGDESSTALAQGGIAAALGADDDPALHLADTLAAGDGLCDAQAAGGILEGAAEAIGFLERQGVAFDRGAGGDFVLGLEAAHRRRRILHAAGDGSGAEILRALLVAVMRTPSITVLAGTAARRILTQDGRVSGLLLECGGQALRLNVPRVVLATGGLGGLYDRTTNPAGNFGQGLALAARAGAALCDMEFVQFHPTALAVETPEAGGGGLHPDVRVGLISEAVRGEGAVLRDAAGRALMAGVPGGDLAARDVVARAIHAEIARGGQVFLDARAVPGFAQRFPAIAALCRAAGLDPARAPLPVCPAAHYHMGGILTEAGGRSTLPGLWAVGECAATGLHGANRLASNSLLEAVVMAGRVARDLEGPIGGAAPGMAGEDVPEAPGLPLAPDPAPLRGLVSGALGILRDGAGLRRAVGSLLPLARGTTAQADPALVALMIAVFAEARRESRGAHARADHPHSLPVPHRQVMTLAQIWARAEMLQPEALARSA